MNDPVTALDRVLDHIVEIGERGLEREHGLLEAVARRRNAGLRRMLDEIGRNDLVEEPEVAVVRTSKRPRSVISWFPWSC
jgi:hypothetical protein